METIEYHILPVVRRVVKVLAIATHRILLGCALLALAEPALLLLHLPLPGILCGLGSKFLFTTAICLLVILAAWGHTVLLAERGFTLSRWMIWVGAMLAPLVPVCWCLGLFGGKMLLYRQEEMPLILGTLLLFCALINLPRMAAASWQLQVRIVALPVLLILVDILDVPGLILACTAFKFLVFLVAGDPLRKLAAVAPRIISLPPRG